MATELAVFDQEFAFQQRDVAHTIEALRQASGGSIDVLDLTQWRVPAGAGTKWQIGDDSYDALSGIILHHKKERAYWSDSYGDGPARPPDCQSPDGVTGFGNPGGECASCALGAWDGPCKGRHQVLVLPVDAVLPAHLVVPQMSIKPVVNYLKKLAMDYGAFGHDVVTKFTLKVEKNAAGIRYAQIVCTPLGSVSGDLVAGVKQYVKKIVESLPQRQITVGASQPPLQLFEEVDVAEPVAAVAGNADDDIPDPPGHPDVIT